MPPLYKVLVEENQLTSRVQMFNYNSELAGQLMLEVRAFDGVDLDKVAAAIEEAFEKFEQDGITDADLQRIKAGQETQFYNGLSSVLGKGFQLAQYQIFAKDPGFINKEVDKILAVTKEDVMAVYRKYIQDKNYIATSFVPKGQPELALEGSTEAEVEEEVIVMGAEEEFQLKQDAEYERTASNFDRSIEPPYGPTPQMSVPEVWEKTLSNGLEVYGITNNEVPLIQFVIDLKGGLLLEEKDKVGVSNLLAMMFTKGTAYKTPSELETAIELLGASINVDASEEKISLYGSTLARNFDETMALVREILLSPRWDKEEFNLAKQQVKSEIQQQQAIPTRIAQNEFSKLIYGDHLLSFNPTGTLETVEGITLRDLQHYYSTKLSPDLASFLIVGSIDKDEALSAVNNLVKGIPVQDVIFPVHPTPEMPEKALVYFYDVPGAKQSVLIFGNPALAETDSDFYPATLMNYRLGGGSFASQLTQELREGKGYTYGIRSSFRGTNLPGTFSISTGVRSNITLEAADLIKEIVKNYGKKFNAHDLEVTKSYMIKSNARKFETLDSKLQMLRNISDYSWPHDYVKQQEQVVEDISVEDIQALAKKYLKPEQMYYLVVGDAATQLKRLNGLGFGDPVLLRQETPETIEN